MPKESPRNPGETLKREISEKVRELRDITDLQGTPIEEGIIESVAMLNLAGIPTSGSCEGHLNRAEAFPWITYMAPGEPKYRWEGEEELQTKALSTIGASESAISSGPLYDANIQAKYLDAFYNLKPESTPETVEYQLWSKENLRLTSLVQRLIKAYTRTFRHQQDDKLVVELTLIGAGGSGQISIMDRHTENAEVAPESLERLHAKREEMGRFASFVLQQSKKALRQRRNAE
jgi:hypothetical protein